MNSAFWCHKLHQKKKKDKNASQTKNFKIAQKYPSNNFFSDINKIPLIPPKLERHR